MVAKVTLGHEIPGIFGAFFAKPWINHSIDRHPGHALSIPVHCVARLVSLARSDTKISSLPDATIVPMAICSRAAACTAVSFPSTAAAAPPSSVSVNRRAQQQWPRKAMAAVMARATGAGGAVLDPPSFDQSQLDTLPPAQEGGDTGRLKDRKGTGSGDSYKVLLLDDPRHTEKHVETALPQVVPSVTAGAARQLFHESRQKGAALVIVAVKEHAEFYAQMMVRHGLRSAIEPESDMAT